MFIPGFKVLLHITHTNGQLDNLFGHHVSETAHQHKLFLESQEQAYKNVTSKHDSRIPCHFTIHTSVLQVFVVHWQLQK